MQWLAAHRVGVWAFLVAVAFVPGIMSAAILPRWAVIAIGVPLMGAIRLRIPMVLQLSIAAGLAWSAATIIQAPDRLDSLLQFFFMVCLLGVMGIGSQLEDISQAMIGLCAGAAVSGILCLEALGNYHFMPSHHPELFPGLFYNSEVLVEFAAPLVVWAVAKRYWLLVVPSIIPMLVNPSRIGIIATAIGLAVVFWPKTRARQMALVGLGAAACVVVVGYITFGNPIHLKFGSAAARITSWLVAIYSITPGGHGFGWWRAAHGGEEFAHSDVLQAFAEIGMGSLFFALVPIYALRNRKDRAAHAAFTVICLELAVSFPLHVPGTGFVAALLAGYLVRECAGVRRVQPDGGGSAGNRDGRYAASGFAAAWGGRRRRFDIPLRSEVAELSAMGLPRGSAPTGRA